MQDEQNTSLIERIRLLESDNAALRSQLSSYNKSVQIPYEQKAADLDQINQTLSIEIAERQRLEQLAQGQLKAQISILQGLTEEADLDKYLGQVMISINEQLQHPDSSLWFTNFEEEISRLYLICLKGVVTKEVPPLQGRHPRTSYPMKKFAQLLSRETIILVDPVNNPDLGMDADTRFWFEQRQVKSILKIPLFMGETHLGSLRVHNSRDALWRQEDIELAQVLSNQIILAVQLTRLAEKAKQAAILEERNRMARDIHDTLAQSFTGIVVHLEATKRKLATAQLDAATEHIAHARNLATQGLLEARRSVQALRPETLESHNLSGALRHLAEQMTAGTDVQLILRIDENSPTLPSEVETNLLRIGQEALTNILKHARAKTICLDLLFEPDTVHLRIRDDGQGFNPQLTSIQQGFGLIGMQERSRKIGGMCSFNSQVGQGTEVTVTVPLSNKLLNL